MTAIADPLETVLPGGILISRVEIYASESPDGQRGGTPHLHLACDELYYVLSGQGGVELIDATGFQSRPLSPGAAICFTPGTIHRAINPEGDLAILVIMQNKGLPERGDVAVCFPRRILSSAEEYRRAMQVQDAGSACRRRDLGVEGFVELKQAFARSPAEGREALDFFYRVAIERTRDQWAAWSRIVEQGPAALVQRSRHFLEALQAGSPEWLRQGRSFGVDTGPEKFGFCGHVHSYQPGRLSPFTPEGVRR